jgi:hypothetical protein
MKLLLLFLRWLPAFVSLLSIQCAGDAQTRVRFNSQVSPLPSVVMIQYASCTGLASCSGLQYAQFKMSDGTTRGPFWLIPTDPNFTLNTNWTSIPVTIQGSTALTCAQLKP